MDIYIVIIELHDFNYTYSFDHNPSEYEIDKCKISTCSKPWSERIFDWKYKDDFGGVEVNGERYVTYYDVCNVFKSKLNSISGERYDKKNNF